MLVKLILYSLSLTNSIGLVQSPSQPSWQYLCQESNVVVVGVVENKTWVVRRDKMVNAVRPLPGGKVEVQIQNPADYVVGSIFTMRVDEVIKKDKKAKTGGRITIFVPGYMVGEGTPALVENQKYLVFLSPPEGNSESFSGTTIYQPGDSSTKGMLFNPQSSYIVVRGDKGAVRITAKNLKIIDEIKAALNSVTKTR